MISNFNSNPSFLKNNVYCPNVSSSSSTNNRGYLSNFK